MIYDENHKTFTSYYKHFLTLPTDQRTTFPTKCFLNVGKIYTVMTVRFLLEIYSFCIFRDLWVNERIIFQQCFDRQNEFQNENRMYTNAR